MWESFRRGMEFRCDPSRMLLLATVPLLGLWVWAGMLAAQTYYYTTPGGSVRHHDLSAPQPNSRDGAPTGGITRKQRLSPGFESKVTRYEKTDRSAAERASQRQPRQYDDRSGVYRNPSLRHRSAGGGEP